MKLQNDLEESNLYDNEKMRRAVMARAIPRALVDQVGLDTILERLPHTYAHSIFSSYVASVRLPASALILSVLRLTSYSNHSATSTRTASAPRSSTSTRSSPRSVRRGDPRYQLHPHHAPTTLPVPSLLDFVSVSQSPPLNSSVSINESWSIVQCGSLPWTFI